MIAFHIIALDTGADKILPAVFSAKLPWNDMINGHCSGFSATILTGMPVTLQYIFAIQHYRFKRPVNIDLKPYDTGKRHYNTDRPDMGTVSLHDLSLAQIDQNDRLSGIADGDRFIILVQYQYILIQITHLTKKSVCLQG
jgi:hypothetical protein